jgi:hypothetical protein
MEIVTVFEVYEYKTGKSYLETIIGCGQEAIKSLRALYPKHTKFVIKNFEVNGKFKKVRND